MSVARFIADQRTNYRVPHAMTCPLLGVSLSWFYKWLSGPGRRRTGCTPPPDRRRAEVDAAVAKAFTDGPRAARLAAAARRPARRRLGGVGEDGGGVDAPPGPGRPPDQAPQRVDQAGQDGAEVPRPAATGTSPPTRPNTKWVGDMTEIPTAGREAVPGHGDRPVLPQAARCGDRAAP